MHTEFLGEVGGGWKSSQKLPARRVPAWTGHTNSAFLKSAQSSLGSSKRSNSNQENSTLGTDHSPPDLVFCCSTCTFVVFSVRSREQSLMTTSFKKGEVLTRVP